MIGMPFVRSSFSNSSATRQPSRPGIITSSRITSGPSSRAFSTPEGPSAASITFMPSASRFTRHRSLIGAVELAEDPLALRRWNSRALIDHAHLDAVSIATRTDGYGAARRRVAQRVLDEDAEHLSYFLGIGLRSERLVGQIDLEAMAVNAVALLGRSDHLGHDRADVDAVDLDL